MTESKNKLKFDPFKNDHQSVQIGELVVENQTDKVTLYGDIDITRTELGLQQALKLQELLNNIVQKLQNAKSESTFIGSTSSEASVTKDEIMSVQSQTRKEVDNPFS